MRIIFLPEDPAVWLFVIGIIVVGVIVVAFKEWLWPPLTKKLSGDERYQQAMGVYVSNLPGDHEPDAEERRAAFEAAVGWLKESHGIAADEARKGLHALVGEYNKARSYDLRQEAITYEQGGAFGLALEYYERAADLRKDHDKEDYEFLQRCIARVRPKARLK